MPTRVFISYSQDSATHKERVHALAKRLRDEGISVILDRDCPDGGPDEGWDKWSEQQATQAEIVLLVLTPTYRQCWDGKQAPKVRQGATHETKVLYRRLYEAGAEVKFCRTVIFEDNHRNCIPHFIAGLHTFNVNRDYANLLGWLRSLGATPPLAPPDADLRWPSSIAAYSWPLADRGEPFLLFQHLITRQRQEQIVLVQGSSGSGKTVLVTEWFKFAKQLGLLAVQLDLKGCPALDELFDTLALEVKAAILPTFHSASGGPRKATLLKDVASLRRPLLLGFDTYQDVSADIADWIEGQLLRRVGQCPGLIIVLSGQQVPDPTRYPWAEQALPLTLPPIKDAKPWHDYARHALGNPDITEDHIEMLLHIHQGDPGQTSAILRSFNPVHG